MWFGRIALGIAFASLVTGASAQDRRPEYGPSITLEAAKKIAAGTLAECQKNSWNVAVAIVDTHGFLVYFERMEATRQYASMDIEFDRKRARAAATYRRPTRVFADAINKGEAGQPRRCPASSPRPAACSIMSATASVDRAAVAGPHVDVTGDQDEQCAKAGTGG